MTKKLLMSFAACSLILTSCNKNDVIENIDSSNGQLSFSPAIGKQTKAAEIMNTSLQTGATSTNAIKLYAYQKTGTDGATWEKWFNDGLYYKDSKWQISSTRFRNASDTKFITYWPKTNVTEAANFGEKTFTAGSFPAFDYTVQDVADQEDLIAGITDLTATKTDVLFKMRHLLSQVNFGVKAYKGAKITITDITVNNVLSKGTYTFFEKETEATVKGRIGAWSVQNTDDNYAYTIKNGIVPATAEKGDLYIFGDGGNFGPGKDANTFYPTGTTANAWEQSNGTLSSKLNNSLILMPQTLKPISEVVFTYSIQDVDDAYVVNNATGKFSLDFATGATSGTDYLGKWEQNYRYVYIIDFTDFLDDNALTFRVDVEAYPWENYNGEDGDGIVKIAEIGQPTEPTINKMVSGATYYMASRTAVAPTAAEKAQLLTNYTWDWTLYDFTNIAGNTGDKITIDFTNVIFNGKTIALTLPAGYTATQTDNATTPLVISAGTNPVVITNTKTNYFRVESQMKAAVELITASGSAFTYTGTTAVNLTGYTMALTTNGNTLTIDFSRSIVTPTVGGAWSWNATTKVATYVKSEDLTGAKAAFLAVTADGVTIYCYDAANIDMTTAFGEPTDLTGMNSGDKVTVVFNVANASRVVGAGTTNGVWATTDNKTYTWTKN